MAKNKLVCNATTTKIVLCKLPDNSITIQVVADGGNIISFGNGLKLETVLDAKGQSAITFDTLYKASSQKKGVLLTVEKHTETIHHLEMRDYIQYGKNPEETPAGITPQSKKTNNKQINTRDSFSLIGSSLPAPFLGDFKKKPREKQKANDPKPHIKKSISPKKLIENAAKSLVRFLQNKIASKKSHKNADEIELTSRSSKRR